MSVTKNRTPKAAADVSAAQKNAIATTPPVVPPVAPEGTVLPPVETPPQPATQTPSVPVVVPTREQLAADKLMNRDLFLKWYSKRPVTGKWVEPTEDQRNERIGALMTERGVKPTDFLKLAGLAQEIETQIAVERAASGIDAQNDLDIAYLRAAQRALIDTHAHIGTMLESLGAKVTTTSKPRAASTTPRATSTSTTRSWKEKNTKLIAHAKSLGLPALVLIDTASGGYDSDTGKHLHCVMAHDNGQWEEVTITSKNEIVPSGKMHDSPIYFKAKDGSRPKYSPAQMFNVHMFGKVVTGTNIEISGGKIKDAADLSVFSAAAGI